MITDRLSNKEKIHFAANETIDELNQGNFLKSIPVLIQDPSSKKFFETAIQYKELPKSMTEQKLYLLTTEQLNKLIAEGKQLPSIIPSNSNEVVKYTFLEKRIMMSNKMSIRGKVVSFFKTTFVNINEFIDKNENLKKFKTEIIDEFERIQNAFVDYIVSTLSNPVKTIMQTIAISVINFFINRLSSWLKCQIPAFSLT